ncbi:MAG: efflux RND transporter periplasmic adaptor subunit [Halioglobus sp.]
MKHQKNRTTRLFSRTRTNLLGVSIAVIGMLSLTSLLHFRADNKVETVQATPLPVVATEFAEQEEYQDKASFLGLIQAGRKTDMAFELPGLIVSVRVNEGTEVQAGDVLATLDTASIRARRKATAAELLRVEAELELAKLKEARQEDLRNKGSVSREAHDETRLRATALSAQTEVVQAQLDSIDIELQKTTIRAPYPGVVSDRYIDEGTVVSAGTPLLKLVEAGTREAHIGIAVSQMERLTAGAAYTLRLRDIAHEAVLVAVRPDVDPFTRAVTVVFQLPGETIAFDGEAVTLALPQNIRMTGGWLPISALLEGERGAWTVLKISSEGERKLAVREVVEVLAIQDDRAYVRGTIVDGDKVIANGVHRVTPGTAVVMAQVSSHAG